MVAVAYSRCPVKFFVWILITLLNGFVSSVAASLGDALTNVTFSPTYLDHLKENSNQTVWIRITYQRWDGKFGPDIRHDNGSLSTTPKAPPPPMIAFDFKSNDASIARVIDPPVSVIQRHMASFHRSSGNNNGTSTALSTNGGDSDDDEDSSDEDNNGSWTLETSFTVKGLFLGKTKVAVQVYALNKDEIAKAKLDPIGFLDEPLAGDMMVAYEYNVAVVRHDKKLAHIFVGTLMILLIVANVLMGTQLNLNIVLEVIKKPFAPAIGFICQFLLMPLISYTLARIFFVPVGLYNLGLGLFTTGCCPGGGASNAYTVLLDGNVDLSITMTFLSTVLSLAMMPLWMFALGRQFLVEQPGQQISIPYKNIAYSLLMLILPLCFGILVRRFWPKFADHGKKLLRPFLGIIIVFICTFGVYANLYMFRLMTWRVLVGGLGLPWLGFVFGMAIAVIARQPKPNVVAISIETGIQNTGIAIMLLQLSFKQPDADLAAVLPVVVAMFTPAPMIMALVIHYVAKWRNEKAKKKQKKASVDHGNGWNTGGKAIENGTSTTLVTAANDCNGNRGQHQKPDELEEGRRCLPNDRDGTQRGVDEKGEEASKMLEVSA